MQGAQSKVYRDILRRVVAHNDEGNYDVELLSNDFTLDCSPLQRPLAYRKLFQRNQATVAD